MSLFRWIWNLLMEIKEERQMWYELKNAHPYLDTRCMTLEQIWSLPCNKYLYELNKEQIDKEIELEQKGCC